MTQRSRVGVFIRELRISKGLSQADLGNKLHVTKKAVSRWETGRGLPDSSMLLPLSEMLGVTVDEILKGEFTISTEYDDFEKRRIEEINSFLKYCCEKRNMINSLIIALISSVSFLIIAYNDVRLNTDSGYMSAEQTLFPFNNHINIDEFSLLTNILLLLLIAILLFAIYRVIIFLKAKNIFKKG